VESLPEKKMRGTPPRLPWGTHGDIRGGTPWNNVLAGIPEGYPWGTRGDACLLLKHGLAECVRETNTCVHGPRPEEAGWARGKLSALTNPSHIPSIVHSTE
jgi:hypothetical protein